MSLSLANQSPAHQATALWGGLAVCFPDEEVSLRGGHKSSKVASLVAEPHRQLVSVQLQSLCSFYVLFHHKGHMNVAFYSVFWNPSSPAHPSWDHGEVLHGCPTALRGRRAQDTPTPACKARSCAPRQQATSVKTSSFRLENIQTCSAKLGHNLPFSRSRDLASRGCGWWHGLSAPAKNGPVLLALAFSCLI